jgi:hypothetical protein
MRFLTALSQYGTLIVRRGQGFSIFQPDLFYTLPVLALLGRGLGSRLFFLRGSESAEGEAIVLEECSKRSQEKDACRKGQKLGRGQGIV